MINEYEKLDIRVQQWIFKQGWNNLREIQSLAIRPILAGNTGVLISASTAASKTEAFFLPAISAIARQEEGVGILYISPLKALINDQDRRLESLSDLLDMPVTPWHGDSPIGRKNKLRKSPAGIVLITPESLESLLIRDPGWVKSAFGNLKHIVIDEFHAFLGSERGQHLLSLLHRLEHLLNRLDSPIPRTALSATLGELEKVPLSLRPSQSFPCEIIKDSKSIATLQVQVRGYVEAAYVNDIPPPSSEDKICADLFKICRGGNHLIFANSRTRTENIAATLSDLCEDRLVPQKTTVEDYKTLLIHMGKSELITQLGSGEIVLGAIGERVVSHYTFYAVFKTPEEFRVVSGAKILGTLPIDSLVLVDQHIVFGGKRWKVKDVDTEKKVIYVIYAKGGRPPKFGGGGMSIHDVVRQEMLQILKSGDYRISVGDQKIDFADKIAKELFKESVEYFRGAGLDKNSLLQVGATTYIFSWLGDKTVNTIVALLMMKGLEAGAYAGVIEVETAQLSEVLAAFRCLASGKLPTENELAVLAPEKQIEKFDEFLPDDILSLGYGAKVFDISSTKKWLNSYYNTSIINAENSWLT
jgi:Lhr-like helicase